MRVADNSPQSKMRPEVPECSSERSPPLMIDQFFDDLLPLGIESPALALLPGNSIQERLEKWQTEIDPRAEESELANLDKYPASAVYTALHKYLVAFSTHSGDQQWITARRIGNLFLAYLRKYPRDQPDISQLEKFQKEYNDDAVPLPVLAWSTARQCLHFFVFVKFYPKFDLIRPRNWLEFIQSIPYLLSLFRQKPELQKPWL